MAFSISVQNNGVDGTIEVNERLNDNQTVQVFNDMVLSSLDGPCSARGNWLMRRSVGVRSSFRPVGAALMAAGLDGVR